MSGPEEGARVRLATPVSGLRPAAAMVLAAGLGTRMRHLTDDRPKPMVAVAGRTLIDHVLDRVAEAGIGRAVVNVHYMADVLERHLAARPPLPQIHISDERDQLLETGGGLVRAAPILWPAGEEHRPVLVHNSDSIWIEGVGRNLDRLIAAWDDAAMDALLLLAPTIASLGYAGRGDFTLDKLGRLERRQERRVAPYVFTGVSLASRRLLAGAPVGPFSLNVLWSRAIEHGRAFGLRLDGMWMHVGDPQALADAAARLAARG